MFENLNKLVELKKQYREAVRKDAQPFIEEAVKQFFDKHGDVVKAVRLRGYTPGFNDGDPCVFSLRELELKLKKEALEAYGDDTYEDDSYWEDRYTNAWKAQSKETRDDFEAMSRAFNAIDDALELIYNSEGFELVMTAKGIEVDLDYDCGH